MHLVIPGVSALEQKAHRAKVEAAKHYASELIDYRAKYETRRMSAIAAAAVANGAIKIRRVL